MIRQAQAPLLFFVNKEKKQKKNFLSALRAVERSACSVLRLFYYGGRGKGRSVRFAPAFLWSDVGRMAHAMLEGPPEKARWWVVEGIVKYT